MYKVVILTFFVITLASQTVSRIDIGSKPVNKNGVKLLNETKIIDDEGYYNSIRSTVAPNGRIVILDKGNYIVYVYDSSGKEISHFGKKGNGPGEIPSGVNRIVASNNYIYLQHWTRIIIFTHQGKYVKTLKDGRRFADVRIEFIEGKLVFLAQNGTTKTQRTIYSEEGEFISEFKNKSKESELFSKEFSAENFRKSLVTVKRTFQSNGKLYQIDPVEYQLNVFDSNFNMTHTLVRSFKKIKLDPKNLFFNKKRPDMSKEDIAMASSMSTVWQNLYKGYKACIDLYSGEKNGYIFLQVSSERGTVLDVISPSYTYFTQLYFDEPNLETVSVKNGKLIKHFNSDEEGPFIKVYDIEIMN